MNRCLDTPEGEAPQGPSKSHLKREMQALQELAERLIAMSRSEFESLTLGAATRAAIDESNRIKDRRARRRHCKHIAKLLAMEDRDAALALVEGEKTRTSQAAAPRRRVERWRERLVEEGDEALTELLGLCPHADRQRLRQLVRTARRDLESGRPQAGRKLFGFLDNLLKQHEPR